MEVEVSGELGAPRSMKMGTTRSPYRYDAAARPSLQSENVRRAAILHCSSWASSRCRKVTGHAIDYGVDVMFQ
jgi:hypothetical protein